MMLEAAAAPRRPFLACAACVAVLTAGCTMCPDPFDYAGPVPNGSAPQNDFLARSNGILPTGVAPKPFPPLVQAEPAGEESPPEEPNLAEEPVATESKIAAAEDEVLRLSAEEAVTESEEGDSVSAEEVAAQPAAVPEAATEEPEPAADPQSETGDWRARGTGEPAGSAADSEPMQRETPGWRARR